MSGYHTKPVEQIVEELAMLKQKYHASHFFFLNNMVNPSRKFVREFSQVLINEDLDIRWSDCAHFGNLNKGIMTGLQEAGAVRLIFGLETGSQRLLNSVDKHFTLEQASRVLQWSHEAGIWNEVELVCGLPGETQEEIEATGRFITDHLEFINYCHPNRFQLKRSQFLKNPVRFGLTDVSRIDDVYHSYRFDEASGMGWKEKEQQIQSSFDHIEEIVGRQFVGTKGMFLYQSNQNLPFLFYLYDLLGSKQEVEAVIHDKWPLRSEVRRAINVRSRIPSYALGAYGSLRKMIAR